MMKLNQQIEEMKSRERRVMGGEKKGGGQIERLYIEQTVNMIDFPETPCQKNTHKQKKDKIKPNYVKRKCM